MTTRHSSRSSQPYPFVLFCAVALLTLLPRFADAQLQTCEVFFGLGTAVDLTDIQFDVGYASAAQAVPADDVNGCIARIPNAALAFNDDFESRILTLGLIRPQLFSGPTEVASCLFAYASIPVEAGDLEISVTAADTLPGGGGAPIPVVPLPDVVVLDIDCGGPTTTLPPDTTTTTTSTSTTTTTRPPLGGTCLLSVQLDDPVDLSVLALDVAYDPANMNFVVLPGGNHCVPADPDHQVSTSNDSAAGQVRAAIAAGASEINGPTGVAHCYLFYVGEEPTVVDFSVSTALAIPTSGAQSDPPPSVSAASVQCPADTATTTTLPAPTTTTTLPATGCGQPQSGNDGISTPDALFILKAVFGQETCDLCVCDVNASGALTVVDAQIALYAALALPADVNCPACQ